MKTYEKFIISVTKPLNGMFSYGEEFVLYPLERQHKPENPLGCYDIYLEICVEKGDPYFRFSNRFAGTQIGRQVVEIMHLLSLSTQFFMSNPRGPICEELESFTQLSYQPIERGETRYYNNKMLNDLNVDVIIFPADLEELIKMYYSLEDDNKIIFRNSMYLFYTGVEIEPINKSLSYIALVASIENLITNSFKEKSEKCCCCGQEKYGISKKFKWFLKNFAGVQDNKYLNQLYSFRSDFVHSGAILMSDREWCEDYMIEFGGAKDDYLIRKNLILVAKRAILTWLTFVAEHNNRYLDNAFKTDC